MYFFWWGGASAPPKLFSGLQGRHVKAWGAASLRAKPQVGCPQKNSSAESAQQLSPKVNNHRMIFFGGFAQGFPR
jgi:hypothetical protein